MQNVNVWNCWAHCKITYQDSVSVSMSVSLRSTSFGDGELNEIRSNDSILNKKITYEL